MFACKNGRGKKAWLHSVRCFHLFLQRKQISLKKAHIVLINKKVQKEKAAYATFLFGGNRETRTLDLTDVNRAL